MKLRINLNIKIIQNLLHHDLYDGFLILVLERIGLV